MSHTGASVTPCVSGQVAEPESGAQPLLYRRPPPSAGSCPAPTAAQLPAVRAVIDQLLDGGRLSQALLVADCFSTSTPVRRRQQLHRRQLALRGGTQCVGFSQTGPSEFV